MAWAACAVAAIALAGCGGGHARTNAHLVRGGRHRERPRHSSPTRFAVGLRVLTFLDRRRVVRYPGRPPGPRRLLTVIRYPATGRAGGGDRPGAAPARRYGPFPLVVFGHGFDVTPTIYGSLLRSWARAGFVVAAPYFPLENEDAPGGADERDLVNQPHDVSFLITRLLSDSSRAGSFLSGLLDPGAVAVAGQSDGGETALALAYDRHFIDHRIRAAVILSGAQIPGGGQLTFPAGSPPLLAVQGTADTMDLPAQTQAFFRLARPPKYLLSLIGAAHLGPYTDEQPQLSIVERVSAAFLARYLTRRAVSGAAIVHAGRRPGIASVTLR